MNKRDLKRVQNQAIQVILQEKYKGYQNSFALLGIEYLDSRRKSLCLDFDMKCVKNGKMCHIFPENIKPHRKDTRKNDIYKVKHSITGSFQNSAISFFLLFQCMLLPKK